MQRSGFFNAILTNGEYDRKYNANDYCDNLAVVISNGVLRGIDDDLKVSAAGLVVTVGVGRAWINGHYYVNDTPHTFAAINAPIGGTRYDRVFLRLDKNLAVRSVSLVYQQGTAGNNPTKPAPVREGNIYDIVLADIYVGTNATNVTITDTRADANLCGWVYSTSGDNSFFASLDAAFNAWFKNTKDTVATVTTEVEYKQLTILNAQTNALSITIPQYDATINQKLDVYVNGMRQHSPTDYTVSGAAITFTGNLTAGTEVLIVITVSKDGTGIPTVIEDITELQNRVSALENGLSESTYTYMCNGVNDNVKLSEIAQEWLNGGTDYGVKTIKIYGTFGATAPYAGDGTSTSPYRWFLLGGYKNRRLIFDFTSCGEMKIPVANGTFNTVFHGEDAYIIGANVVINNTAAETVVRIFSSTVGAVFAEKCRFWITAYKDSRIGQTGTFNNCRASVANVINNSYCFLPFSASLLRINGGEYYAYVGDSTEQSAVVGQSAADAVTILNGVNAPTLSRSGFYQTNSVLQWAGGGILSCTDLVSALPLIVVAGISNIRGTIAKSKAGAM